MDDEPRPLRVLHLAGSPTSDFYAEVSRLYAAGCLEALADVGRYQPLLAWVEPGGAWRFPTALNAEAVTAAPSCDLTDAVRRIEAFVPDVAVPQMFCLPGMTHYRALLDVLGVPYPGNPPVVMAIGADKALTRAVVAAGGVDVPVGQVVTDDEACPLPLPVVVKPVDADNSLGVTLVRRPEEYADAVAAAREHSTGVLVEEFVPLGREVRCAVVDVHGTLRCLPLEEYAVDPVTKPVRDAADKLRSTGVASQGLSLVAKDADHAWIVPDDDPAVPAVHASALRAYRALGCRSYGLFDFRLDADGRPWFLEAGLYCSYSRTSVVAVMAAAAGLDVQELFTLGLASVGVDEPARPVTTERTS